MVRRKIARKYRSAVLRPSATAKKLMDGGVNECTARPGEQLGGAIACLHTRVPCSDDLVVLGERRTNGVRLGGDIKLQRTIAEVQAPLAGGAAVQVASKDCACNSHWGQSVGKKTKLLATSSRRGSE